MFENMLLGWVGGTQLEVTGNKGQWKGYAALLSCEWYLGACDRTPNYHPLAGHTPNYCHTSGCGIGNSHLPISC